LCGYWNIGTRTKRCKSNGASICLNCFMLLMGLDKGMVESIPVCCIFRWFIHWTKQHKAGCYIGKVSLNHLMYADDICVFGPSVCGLQSILDLHQAHAESHRIIFNCSKTVCMMFNPFSPAKTTFHAELCNPITCQAIELESYSNPLRIQQVL